MRLHPHITDEEWEKKYAYLENGVTETEGPPGVGVGGVVVFSLVLGHQRGRKV